MTAYEELSMLRMFRAAIVAIGLVVGPLGLAGQVSAQIPIIPPMIWVVVEISPRAAVQAGADWTWSPADDLTKINGPYLSGESRLVPKKIRITPRKLHGPCVAPAAVDIEVTSSPGYVLLAYSGAGCGA